MQSVLLLALLACASACAEVQSDPNFVGQDPQSQVVTIGAGRALVSGPDAPEEQYWRLWYIIDPATRTCWFKIGDSVGRLECCRLWTLPKAKPFLVNRMRLSCPATESPGGAD